MSELSGYITHIDASTPTMEVSVMGGMAMHMPAGRMEVTIRMQVDGVTSPEGLIGNRVVVALAPAIKAAKTQIEALEVRPGGEHAGAW